MFDNLFNRTPAIRPGYLDQPATPLTIRLSHVDRELSQLAAVRPRTGDTWAAINFQLDRRLRLRGGAS